MMHRIWLIKMSSVGLFLGRDVCIGPDVLFSITDDAKCHIGEKSSISRGVTITAQGCVLEIGAHSFVGSWSTIVARAGIKVGEHCLIAERVSIRDQDHRIHGDIGVHICCAGMAANPIRIGNGVWIGVGAVVLKGSIIGDGAVVAANAVVKGNIPSRAIVAGVPARIVGYRRESIE